MNIKCRKEFIELYTKTYKSYIEDNCHMSILKEIKILDTLLIDKLNRNELVWIKINTGNLCENEHINLDKYNDVMKWRKFYDNNTGEYIEKTYRGHSCPGIIHNNTIYVFDPILMPWKYAMRGLEIEQYLLLTTKPINKTIAYVQTYSLEHLHKTGFGQNNLIIDLIKINLKTVEMYNQYDINSKLTMSFDNEWFNYFIK